MVLRLQHFRDLGLLKQQGQQRTDSMHVRAAIRTRNRLEMVGETLRYALNTLATVVPEWTYANTTPEWVQRYDKPVCDYRKKRSKSQVGYKIHLTETCDKEYPRLITQVETTAATVYDATIIPTIHHALNNKTCLPQTHLVDSGFISAEHLADSYHHYDIDLLGPTRGDTTRQTRRKVHLTTKDFEINWEQQHAICPAGKKSLHWLPARNTKGKDTIQIKFSKHDCRLCDLQTLCTRSNPPRRSITIQGQMRQQALDRARAWEQTEAFKQAYA